MTLASEIITDSPKGYWKLDDATTTVADSSGNSHTGTAGASVGLSGLGLGNVPAKAMWVNRPQVAGGLATVASHADFNVGDTFTLECCVRVRQDFQDLGSGGFNPPVFGANGGSGPGLGLGTSSGVFPYYGQVDDPGVADSRTIFCSSTVAIADTHLWHHLIVTKTGSTVHLYLDGVDVTGSVTAHTFSAGNLAIFMLSPYARFSLSHCAIYNTALSSARVAAHYTAFSVERTPTKTYVDYGLHVDSMYNSVFGLIDSQIATVASVHGRLARSIARWDIIQTGSGGAYDWARHDEYVRICGVYGVTPWFFFMGSPTWLTGSLDTQDIPGIGADATFQAWVTSYQTFVGDFVNRYKPGGTGPYTIAAPFWIELWNEPNLQGAAGNNANGFWNNISANTTQQKADQYAYFYRNIRSTILANYASARVVFAGLSSWGAVGGAGTAGETYLRDVVGSSSWSSAPIDYMAYHPYTNSDNPDSHQNFDNHFNDVLLVVDVLKQLGYTPPLCLSEFGVSGSNQATQNTNLTTMLSRIRDEWSSLCPVAIWFRDYDAFGSNYGLFSTMPADGTASTDPKTAAATFTVFAGGLLTYEQDKIHARLSAVRRAAIP